MDDGPPGPMSACHQSVWITDIFCRCFDHFIQFAKPTETEPVILVLDGRYSHTRNIQVIKKSRNNHALINCLPPHSTAKMQPLDVNFMNPLKTYCAEQNCHWLGNNPGCVVRHQVEGLLSHIYQTAATLQISMNFFLKTGTELYFLMYFDIHAG